MRILLLTPMPPRAEAPGAIPLTLHAAVTGLRARHDVTLVTAVGDEDGEVDALAALRRAGIDILAADRRAPAGAARWRRRCRMGAAWTFGGAPWRTVWFADPALQQLLDDAASRGRFDVVAVEDNAMAGFRLPPGLPTVLTEHEVRRPRRVDWRRAARGGSVEILREADWRRWPDYQRVAWRRFDRIQVFTRRDAERASAIAPDLAGRIRVNPFGLDVSVIDGPIFEAERPLSILFVGNFTHPPNLDAAGWLVGEIMPDLRRRVPGVRLTLVGGGADAALKALSRPDVVVRGEVPVIAPELAHAAVVVAPIRTGGGMRMKVLRALAAGKAVVTTSRGADGLLLPAGDLPLAIADSAAEFAERTAALLDDHAARRRLGERARSFVLEQHSAAAYADRLEAVYCEAIASRTADGSRRP